MSSIGGVHLLNRIAQCIGRHKCSHLAFGFSSPCFLLLGHQRLINIVVSFRGPV